MDKLSAVLLTKNEEKNIERCLESIAWVDEIVVVDTGSTDQTVPLAQKYNAAVFQGDIGKGFAFNRNLGNDKARNSWILKMEPDEVIPPVLRQEIEEIMGSPPSGVNGYYSPRRNYFAEKWIRGCGWYPMPQIRLFDKRRSHWEGLVREWLEVEGETGSLKNDVFHYSYNDIQHYFQKFNLYTSFDAMKMKEQGRRVTGWNAFSTFCIRPGASFIKDYFFRKGWKDGFYGYVVSVCSAFYVLVKYLKLYEIQKKEDANIPKQLTKD